VEFQLVYVWFSAFSCSCFLISQSLYCVLRGGIRVFFFLGVFQLFVSSKLGLYDIYICLSLRGMLEER